MFDRIARVYDPMNLLISAFQEPRWRRRLVEAAGLRRGGSAIDVATGTGKVAADLNARFMVGDALSLPVADRTFDAATIAFGMRNLPDYRRGFDELARVVSPGGRVLCLEIARPRSHLARVLRWWFDRVVPIIGRLAGQGSAYAYLVRSVQDYPAPERIAEIMREAGLVDVSWRGFSGGIVTLHQGTLPER
jgi:demethylmenaquinone methyltransferase/2-methoxy-6-polyprenyl-1,4-benzoquinol methylase